MNMLTQRGDIKMEQCIYYGEFNAEKYWRNEKLAKLPEIPNNQIENIIKSMDELLFILCSEKDTLITRYKIDPAQIKYLKDIGFSFTYNNTDLTEDVSKEEQNKNICQILLEKYDELSSKELMKKNSTISAFAVLPESINVSKKYGFAFDSPEINIIKKVNSKIYSSEINRDLNSKYPFKIANSSKELYEEGMKYLNNSPIMIKDSFGVSGKGNLVISNEGILQRIVSYINSQEKARKSVEFIIESFLDKERDFSCQFFIHKSGDVQILSIQEVRNTGSSYHGSYTPSKEFVKFIRERGYFSIIKEVSAQLYKDGYYGDVCIDSMVLKNGDIVPIVEINARKSMSLIKHNIDKYVLNFNLKCSFTFLNVAFSTHISYEQIIKEMEEESLLFKPGMNKGLIPLSSNALFINRYLDKNQSIKTYKGRLYLAILYKNEEEKEDMLSNLTQLLNKNQINVLN